MGCFWGLFVVRLGSFAFRIWLRRDSGFVFSCSCLLRVISRSRWIIRYRLTFRRGRRFRCRFSWNWSGYRLCIRLQWLLVFCFFHALVVSTSLFSLSLQYFLFLLPYRLTDPGNVRDMSGKLPRQMSGECARHVPDFGRECSRKKSLEDVSKNPRQDRSTKSIVPALH